MCLGVPGQVVSVTQDPLGMHMGEVSFAGIKKKVCLAYTPEAAVGDYVVVHVGFAISRIDEEEARQVFQFLAEMDELGELDIPQPGESPGPRQAARSPHGAPTPERSAAGDGLASGDPPQAAKHAGRQAESAEDSPAGGGS